MGIYYMPPQRYKCSECGSENGKEYSEPPATSTSGYWHGVVCPNCGHKTRMYKRSIFEEEAGSSTSITSRWNEPQNF